MTAVKTKKIKTVNEINKTYIAIYLKHGIEKVYTTYIEISGRHIYIRRLSSWKFEKIQVNVITLHKESEAIKFLDEVKEKLNNKFTLTTYDSTAFSLMHNKEKEITNIFRMTQFKTINRKNKIKNTK